MEQMRGEGGRFASKKDIARYEVTVWNIMDGDIEGIEEQYRDEPGYEIQIEERF